MVPAQRLPGRGSAWPLSFQVGSSGETPAPRASERGRALSVGWERHPSPPRWAPAVRPSRGCPRCPAAAHQVRQRRVGAGPWPASGPGGRRSLTPGPSEAAAAARPARAPSPALTHPCVPVPAAGVAAAQPAGRRCWLGLAAPAAGQAACVARSRALSGWGWWRSPLVPHGRAAPGLARARKQAGRRAPLAPAGACPRGSVLGESPRTPVQAGRPPPGLCRPHRARGGFRDGNRGLGGGSSSSSPRPGAAPCAAREGARAEPRPRPAATIIPFSRAAPAAAPAGRTHARSRPARRGRSLLFSVLSHGGSWTQFLAVAVFVCTLDFIKMVESQPAHPDLCIICPQPEELQSAAADPVRRAVARPPAPDSVLLRCERVPAGGARAGAGLAAAALPLPDAAARPPAAPDSSQRPAPAWCCAPTAFPPS